jgi:hypothetical protein
MPTKFLKMIKFSRLASFWKKLESVKLLVFSTRFNVILSNYGLICKSEKFYENSRNFFWIKRGELLLKIF